jgi:ATP-dependent RNA helicase DHX36
LETTGNVAASVDDLQQSISSSEDQDVSLLEEVEGVVPIALAGAVVAHLAKTTDEGAILVFLPGLQEILKLDQDLRTREPLSVNFGDMSKFKMIMLHSSVSSASQSEVFNSVPDGCRKIILATNIAETSVTIPDVRYVVDTGKLRENHYDQMRKISRLHCRWISKSNAKQRAGRAGRVRDGYYYALFSIARREMMRDTGSPELLRSDLQEVCLNVKARSFNLPIGEFLGRAIEPPPPSSVSFAIIRLKELEALTDAEELTPLGRVLSSL